MDYVHYTHVSSITKEFSFVVFIKKNRGNADGDRKTESSKCRKQNICSCLRKTVKALYIILYNYCILQV
jgi:hypothetical protein